jgi:hypothetical protein
MLNAVKQAACGFFADFHHRIAVFHGLDIPFIV